MDINNLIKKSAKILDIENIKIIGKNKKYIRSATTGQNILSPEYRKFEEEIYFSAQKLNLEPPYFLYIRISCAHDIDGPESCIIDAMQGKAYKNDKDIIAKLIIKEKIKRGSPGSIKAYLAHVED